MKDRILKYAIAIGDEWFTGFTARDGFHTRAGYSSAQLRLLEEDAVLLALRDLDRCGITGRVYDVEITIRTRDVPR